MRFEFASASRILFGEKTVHEAPALAARMGRRALVITGGTPLRSKGFIDSLQDAGISVIPFSIAGEPTTDIVLQAAATGRSHACDLVIGIGGGSVIDGGKAIAALLTNPGELFDYLEVIGKAQALPFPPAPYIAIPTSAGTGTEVTRNAVIISREHKVKVSMRSEMMLPKLVVVDPELTYSMPPGVTATTGLDALTQLIEAYVSRKSNPLTDGICREGLVRAARSLKTAFENGNDADARRDMCLASLFSGIALANAGLGAVHGFAAPIGGRFDAPHGLVCARLLPAVMDTNIRALNRKHPGSPALMRYDDIAGILTGDPSASAPAGISWIQRLCRDLRIDTLRTIGISESDIQPLVASARKASSMKGNPIELTEEELEAILRSVMTPAS